MVVVEAGGSTLMQAATRRVLTRPGPRVFPQTEDSLLQSEALSFAATAAEFLPATPSVTADPSPVKLSDENPGLVGALLAVW